MQLELTGVEKTYNISDSVKVPALSGIDLRIEAGEFVSLVGPSGCGKSTLLSILGLLTWPTAGCYSFDGRDTRTVSRRDQARWRGDWSVRIRS